LRSSWITPWHPKTIYATGQLKQHYQNATVHHQIFIIAVNQNALLVLEAIVNFQFCTIFNLIQTDPVNKSKDKIVNKRKEKKRKKRGKKKKKKEHGPQNTTQKMKD